METAQYHGIEIDRCTLCSGILLDKGELEQIDAKDLGGVIDSAQPHDESADAKPAHCYECDKGMIALVAAGDVQYDWCEGCERLFFDKGELATFDAYVES